jgi:hypothetical protein
MPSTKGLWVRVKITLGREIGQSLNCENERVTRIIRRLWRGTDLTGSSRVFSLSGSFSLPRTYLKIDLRRQGSVAFWASDLSNLRNPWKDRGRYPGFSYMNARRKDVCNFEIGSSLHGPSGIIEKPKRPDRRHRPDRLDDFSGNRRSALPTSKTPLQSPYSACVMREEQPVEGFRSYVRSRRLLRHRFRRSAADLYTSTPHSLHMI